MMMPEGTSIGVGKGGGTKRVLMMLWGALQGHAAHAAGDLLVMLWGVLIIPGDREEGWCAGLALGASDSDPVRVSFLWRCWSCGGWKGGLGEGSCQSFHKVLPVSLISNPAWEWPVTHVSSIS